MAKSVKSFYLLASLFILLLVATEVPTMAEGKLCSRLSKTWHGFCGISRNCDRQCRNWESAFHGACHRRGLGFACFCYYKC